MIMVIDEKIADSLFNAVCPYPPTPQHCLFFYISDPIRMQKEGDTDFLTQPPSVIVGPQVTRVNLDIGKHHRAVCVGFHPGGLYRLIGIPMSHIFDDGFDATDIIGNEMNKVNLQLKEAITFEDVKNVIEKFLFCKVQKLKAILPFDFAMKELIHHHGNIAIEKIASLSCLSLRQFERKCIERIGMPPKLFARLARFSNAHRLKGQQSQLSWTSIAYECGYFDQMHLIRDFKEFAGVTPTIMEEELYTAPLLLQAGFKI